jgi:hypothetical protein
MVSSKALCECGCGILVPTGTVNSNIATEPFVSAASRRNLIPICPTRIISFFIKALPERSGGISSAGFNNVRFLQGSISSQRAGRRITS